MPSPVRPAVESRRPAPPTRLPFRVRTLGRMRHAPYHSTPGTWFDDAMLTVVLAGRGVYHRAGQVQQVTAGMIGMVLPDAEAREAGLLMADPADPYDHLYCRFAGDEAMRTARRIVVAHGQGGAFFTTPRCGDVADVLMRALALPQQTWRRPASDQRMDRCDALLAEALAILDAPDDAPQATGLTADRLRAYLIDHVANPTDLAAVAAHFGVSKAHLCRCARPLLGDTVQRSWERIKIERACLLLREPSLRVIDVARRVGYTDPFYFSKVFRRHRRASPSQWREP